MIYMGNGWTENTLAFRLIDKRMGSPYLSFMSKGECMKFETIFKIIVGLFVIGGIYLVAKESFHRHQPAPSIHSETLKMPVAKATPQHFTLSKDYIGFAQTPQSVYITPNIEGFIADTFVTGGEKVSEGDILFIIDQRPYLADLAAAVATVEQTKAQAENAFIYYERMKNTKKQAVSASDLDTAHTNFKSAKAAYQQALAKQKQAEINYEYTFLTAPFNGILGNVTIADGDYVTPQSQLAYLTQSNPIRIEFSIPTDDADLLNQLTEDWNISLVGKNGEELLTEGSISFAGNKINTASASLPVYADFFNPQNFVLPGAAVVVRFEQQIDDGILIDKNLVQHQPTGDFVFLIKGEKIVRQPVQIGHSVAEQYYITDGITPGDLIITVPVRTNQVGQSVAGVLQ